MNIILVRTFLLVVGLVGATVSAKPPNECAYTNQQLPKHIVPKHYDLDLNIDTQEDEYTGKVIIHLDVKSNKDKEVPNNIIVLHAHPDITIKSVEYKEIGAEPSSSSQKRPKAEVGFCRYDLNELLVINLNKDLAENIEAELTVSFKTEFRSDSTGIYKTGDLISTDFKPDRARRAFPCFDDPFLKATFDISLTHDPAKVALANTVLISEDKLFGPKVSKFERTPPMSTYLIAFAIGDFDRIATTISDRGLTIEAFTQVGKSEQARFALRTAVSAIRYMEEYFAAPFPHKKLDMLSGVKLNSDARENWGLIVFKDSLFLYDEEATLPLAKAQIARTVIHQLALQWFGNLITVKWWNDLWLAEAFAGWMEIHLTDKLYPEFQIELYHLIETHQEVLDYDSHVRPIRVSELEGNPSEMAYYKSVEIIRLLHDAYLGPEQFKSGMRRHISHNKHKTVDANNLWEALKGDTGLPVDEFIKSWTEQSGHPLVTAQIVVGEKRRLILKQQRDQPAGLFAENNQDRGVWIIPVTVLVSDETSKQAVHRYIIDKPEQEVLLPDWFDYSHIIDHWYKVNQDSRGFYRVSYPGDIMIPMYDKPCAQRGLVSLNNRVGLIADATALLQNDLVSFYYLKAVLRWCIGETQGSVLGEVARAYSILRQYEQGERDFGLGLFVPAFHEFGLQNELLQNARTSNRLGVMDIEGLVRAYNILIELNYEPFIEAALDKFNTEGDTVVPRLRELVYKAVAFHAPIYTLGTLKSFVDCDDIDEEERGMIEAILELVPERLAYLEYSIRTNSGWYPELYLHQFPY